MLNEQLMGSEDARRRTARRAGVRGRLAPRWAKVLRDVTGNRTRTVLVALSIAIGVLAIGAIAGTRAILLRDMHGGYLATNPASAIIVTRAPFDDDLVEAVRAMPEVRDAEGRRAMPVRLRVGDGPWWDITLIAMPDDGVVRINALRPQAGAWPPPRRTVVLERASLAYLGAPQGATVTLRGPNGADRVLQIAGTAHDIGQMPPFVDGNMFGYVSWETLEWLGGPRNYNELRIIAGGDVTDRAHVAQVAMAVEEKVERSGREVGHVVVLEPGRHPLGFLLDGIVLVLGAVGILGLLLSVFLVVNTVQALIAQQLRQIGVMKAIGARFDQLVGLYLVTVLAYGALAAVVALPLGALGAQGLAGFLAEMFNFDVSDTRMPAEVIALQVAVALLAPLAAALWPVLAGARVTVREAIAGQGPGAARRGWRRAGAARPTGAVEAPPRLRRLLACFPRPLLLSLRNTFRRKGRLALTLSTLALAGAIFITVLGTRDTLQHAVDDMITFYQYDVWVTLDRPYRTDRLSAEALRVPGVVAAEGWGLTQVRRERPNGTQSANFVLMTPPAESEMLRPNVVEGRWLRADDAHAIVLATALLREESTLRLGDTIRLTIAGREGDWQVVGFIQSMLPVAYVNQPYYAHFVGEVNQSSMLMVRTASHDAATQTEVAQALERSFDRAGLGVSSIVKIEQERGEISGTLGVVTGLLLMMALLLAAVGGLGLMGTMSLNVLERTREIGVLRAIGASDGAVLRVVIGEGLVIGALSWLGGALLAVPFGVALSTAMGVALLGAPLAASYSLGGALAWLVAVLVLATVASALPARAAARTTVRAALAYE